MKLRHTFLTPRTAHDVMRGPVRWHSPSVGDMSQCSVVALQRQTRLPLLLCHSPSSSLWCMLASFQRWDCISVPDSFLCLLLLPPPPPLPRPSVLLPTNQAECAKE